MGCVLEISCEYKKQKKIDRRSLMEKRNHHSSRTETQHISCDLVVGLFLF